MPLPSWLNLDAAKLREQCGLDNDQVQPGLTNSAFETLISAHITAQATYVLDEAQLAAGPLSFPSTDTQLQTAFLVEMVFPVLVGRDATACDIYEATEDARDAAAALSLPANNIFLKFETLTSLKKEADLSTSDRQAKYLTQSQVNAAATAASDERTRRIEGQQETAKLAVTSFVYAKLWYATVASDTNQAQAKGHWMTACALLKSLRDGLGEIRTRYQLNGSAGFI
jgi:hypothetical protein